MVYVAAFFEGDCLLTVLLWVTLGVPFISEAVLTARVQHTGHYYTEETRLGVQVRKFGGDVLVAVVRIRLVFCLVIIIKLCESGRPRF